MGQLQKAIQINKRDNVAVVLEPLEKGSTVIIGDFQYTLAQDLPLGHKFALDEIKAGKDVIKYGHAIGQATADINPGEWLHSHNMRTNLEGKISYEFKPEQIKSEMQQNVRDSFDGYPRASGAVGTRNELWIIPTVSCVNSTVVKIAKEAEERFHGFCDGIHALPHNAGCSQLGEDHETTQKILRSIIRHPNAGGVLLVSLGCENNDLDNFLPILGDVDTSRVKWIVTQDIEGEEVEAGLDKIEEILKAMNEDKRVPTPVSKLCIGFKCGGSDALSGITANPLCGHLADRITSLGGAGVLTEVPEMFGAETSLMARAKDKQVFEQIVSLIDGFKQYYLDYNQPIYENPSPGNRAGGITTLEEKSLGCIQKGGHAVVTDTLDYGQQYVRSGINLMTGPGNDSVSITNLVAAGAQVILFTTGRGNPLGTAIPIVKIASNDDLAKRKENWIDFNAGGMLAGKSPEELSDELWNMTLDTASGKYITKNELNDNREIMIFKNGVLL